ncbi:histidine phosphatase family protein [Lysinibacillus cavernae]|uniref:histidine phosphatase family protein n=1 Tax=Lysinibacillus cavernae TaxID=2666135 RepID=UPI0012D87513|nr:histidine phosphatase family protein [Lysinibacillus cavernae]
METSILLVRHAASPFIFGEERSRGLSEKGKKDATTLTEAFRSIKIDVMVSSPYWRAIQTIQGMADYRNLEIKIIEGLRERQLKGAYQLPADEREEAIKLSFEDFDFHLHGGESVRHVQNRAIPEIMDLLEKYQGKTIVVGTHGNIMTIIMNYFDARYGYEFWKSTTKPDSYQLFFVGTKLKKVHRVTQEGEKLNFFQNSFETL